MSDPVTQALERLVEQSTSPDELSRRVIQSFGEGKLPHARQIAAEMKGFDWLRQSRSAQAATERAPEGVYRPSVNRLGFLLLGTPRFLVLVVGTALLVLVLLFPPFLVPLPQGLVNNAGFAFILTPPIQGSLTAIVNTPLLALLAFGVVIITAVAYLVARGVEASSASSPSR